MVFVYYVFCVINVLKRKIDLPRSLLTYCTTMMKKGLSNIQDWNPFMGQKYLFLVTRLEKVWLVHRWACRSVPEWETTFLQQPSNREWVSKHLTVDCTVVSNDMKSTRRVLGHSLLRSLVRSHLSLICLLHTARFARALRCVHSFTRSRAHWKETYARHLHASIS